MADRNQKLTGAALDAYLAERFDQSSPVEPETNPIEPDDVDYFVTAGTLKAAFTKSTRDDGSTYHHLVADVPSAVVDFVRELHDDELPNDWRYAAIVGLLEGICESNEEIDSNDLARELADAETDIGTAALLRWYADNCSRTAYVDAAKEEGLIGADTSLVNELQAGQHEALTAMAYQLINRLGQRK